jgi:hypothetical protein
MKRRDRIHRPLLISRAAPLRRAEQRRLLLLAIALVAAVLTLYAGAARSETVVIGDQVSVRPSDLARPARGMTMHSVEAKFGAPDQRHEAVGQPPISRWDYHGFTVYFEKDRVIHAVVDPGP